jgi:hypothetical protein
MTRTKVHTPAHGQGAYSSSGLQGSSSKLRSSGPRGMCAHPYVGPRPMCICGCLVGSAQTQLIPTFLPGCLVRDEVCIMAELCAPVVSFSVWDRVLCSSCGLSAGLLAGLLAGLPGLTSLGWPLSAGLSRRASPGGPLPAGLSGWPLLASLALGLS